MTNPIARRYATALFDVVRKNGGVERAEQDLIGLTALLAANPELAAAFSSAAVPPQKKRAVVDALVTQGNMSGEVGRLLTMLAERGRLDSITAVAAAFAERLQIERHITSAEIVTAVPIDDARRDALAQALGRASGGTVAITARVDPNIIGGVVAKVGGTVYDGSVTTQLEHMRRRLTS